MSFVFTAPPQPVVSVAGTGELFPVRRIFCVGRNYAAHAKEMGSDPDQPPVFFTKPADAVTQAPRIAFPSLTQNLHHEIELVVALQSGGRDIAKDAALAHVFGYAAGLDLTRRDLQSAAKDKGNPWDTGKAFDLSAPISPITPVASIGHPTQGRIWLEVNGQVRQDADIHDLMWGVPAIIMHLSRYFELKAGDLIFTGTPEGVGPIQPGDRLSGGVVGIGALEIVIG
jgi:fumarylpyruvate hydrolase